MSINDDEINKLIAEADELVTADESSEDSVDETYTIEVSEDKMVATITFTKPKRDGKYLSVEEIYAAIAAAGIVNGLERDIIDLLALPTKVFDYPIEIAKGLEPVPSVDAFIEYTHDLESGATAKLKEDEDGTVDLFDLGLIQNVNKGELLATLHPMISGTDGKDVYGTDLVMKDGKPLLLAEGKGTELSEDKLQLFAALDGQLTSENGKLMVQNIYEVAADVDTSTGNIDFVGSVIIKGSVRAGFAVKAEGNVEVSGVVEAASIEAGGDVIITGGMQGSKVGKIVAGGNVVAKFLENAIVEAKGDVMADAIMHSDVKCSGLAVAQGKKGLIVGGSIEAYKGIKAKTIGSHMATQTELNVGVNLQIADKYKELQDALAANKKDLLQAEQIIHILEQKKKELGGLPDDKVEMLQKSYKTVEYLKSIAPTIEEKVETLREVIDHVNKFTIEATDTIYTGVKVNIANEKRTITEEIVHSRLSKRDGEIRIDVL